jgi:hypothetical protein
LSGGTLLATRDAKWLIAADPDRDRLYFIDVEAGSLSHVRELPTGSEPGRVIEDDAGRIHVALRSRGALVSLRRAPDSQMTERAVCAEPRGLAYDNASDTVHVACADGSLVSVGADVEAGVTRKLSLDRDLRDLIVRGDELWVTRFRSAEVLRIGADGSIVERKLPPSVLVRGAPDLQRGDSSEDEHSPTVAWRALDIPGKGSAILHQRATVETVRITTDGYGSVDCSGILQTSVTIGLDAERTVSADLADAVVAIDMAVNPSGTLLAVVSPGNWRAGGVGQLSLFSLTGSSPLNPRAPAERLAKNIVTFGEPSPDGGVTSGLPRQTCMFPEVRYPTPIGQVTSVTFIGSETIAMFEREPAAISFMDVKRGRITEQLELGQASAFDPGHGLFHMRTPSGIACASCHPEAGDDSHAWLFERIGRRRTQSLRGGILGSEPFHWDGDMSDFAALVSDVLVQRMGLGRPLAKDKTAALADWIDTQPRLAATVRDEDQAARGKKLFESEAVGCASCHAGPLLTDNHSVDVGTGAAFQVPALRGVSYRLPIMHDGCAQTLRQRFDAACGGDRHGNVSQLEAAEIADLIAYLETL